MLERWPVNRQGYDRNGRYFGVGEKLWRYTFEHGNDQRQGFLRAPNRAAAMKEATRVAAEFSKWPYAPVSGLGAAHSMGQRVMTPHGHGVVRSASGQNVGVQLDDGSYVIVGSHEVKPSDSRQRFFNGPQTLNLSYEQKYEMAKKHPEVVKLFAAGQTLKAQLKAHEIAQRIRLVETGSRHDFKGS